MSAAWIMRSPDESSRVPGDIYELRRAPVPGKNRTLVALAAPVIVMGGRRAALRGCDSTAENPERMIGSVACNAILWYVACNDLSCRTSMTRKTTNARVQKHRDALRRAGLRPVQIWVPDTRRTDFGRQCRSQSRRVAAVDRADTELSHFLEEALADVDGWSA